MGHVAIVSVLASCAPPQTQRTLDGLEAQQQRLAELQAEIAESERQAEQARRAAAYEQCRATSAAIQAGFALRRAACAHALAEHQAGPAPACLAEAPRWLEAEAAAHGHAGIPMCRASIEIAEITIAMPEALRVSQVFPWGAAAQAGLQEGDVLLRLDGHWVRTDRELLHALQAAAPGEKLTVEYVRAGTVHTGSGVITREVIAREGQPVLGVQIDEVDDVLLPAITVRAVAGTRLAVGDRITAIGGAQLAHTRAAAEAFMKAPGPTVTITVERDGQLHDVEVELAP